MKMGLNEATAACGATARNAQGVVYDYRFEECGTRLILDQTGKFVYENHISRQPLMVNG